jgi:hypothetical protein
MQSMSEEAVLERIDPKRRAFMKRVLVGTAFAAPAMVSFDTKSISVHVGSNAYASAAGSGGNAEG